MTDYLWGLVIGAAIGVVVGFTVGLFVALWWLEPWCDAVERTGSSRSPALPIVASHRRP